MAQRSALQKLRQTIRSIVPDATEGIAYQMPAFKAHGRWLVAYAAFADHYSLFPMGVSVVNAHLAELEPYLSGKSTLRFAYGKPLPVRIVKMVVKERSAENAAKAKPSGTRAVATKRSGGPSTAR